MRQEIIIQECEVLDEGAFTAEQLAQACGVTVTWVHTHIELGVLDAQGSDSGRFDSATLARARRVVQLENTFDADPQMAALTADLMEEVAQLRRRLRALGL